MIVGGSYPITGAGGVPFSPVYFPYPGKEERVGGASFKNLKEMPPSKRGARRGLRSRGLYLTVTLPSPRPDAPGNTSSPNLTYIFHRFARLSSAPAPLSRTFSAVTIPYGDRSASRQKLSSKNDEAILLHFRGNAFNDRQISPDLFSPLEKKRLFRFSSPSPAVLKKNRRKIDSSSF